MHFGLLQSLHKTFCTLLAALWMSLSEKALFGNVPHHRHCSVISSGPSPLQRKHRRVTPGAMILAQYASNHSVSDIATFKNFLYVPVLSSTHDWQAHTMSFNRCGFLLRRSASAASSSKLPSGTFPCKARSKSVGHGWLPCRKRAGEKGCASRCS